MTEDRKNKLKNNFTLMFWVRALTNLKMMNLISSLFYIQRGLTLSQIFYTSIVFAAVSFLFEIPSSYLADKWGRKKTLLLATAFTICSFIIQIFATEFVHFIFAFVFLSLSFACITGTDEAIIYDTNKELGNEEASMSKIGRFYSASRLFKIITPIIAAFIAKDLLEWQFVALIAIDAIAAFAGFLLILRMTEPNHYMDVEKLEAGTLIDAIRLLRSDYIITKAIFSKSLLFISTLIIWKFYQYFFVNLGVSIMLIGFTWGFCNIIIFVFMHFAHTFTTKKSLVGHINNMNLYMAISSGLLVLCLFLFPNPYILLFFNLCFFMIELMRAPLYSEFFNKKILSHNRSTTLSLTNFVRSILDIPILLFTAFLANIHTNYVFVFSFFICVVVVFFFRIPNKLILSKTSD